MAVRSGENLVAALPPRHATLRLCAAATRGFAATGETGSAAAYSSLGTGNTSGGLDERRAGLDRELGHLIAGEAAALHLGGEHEVDLPRLELLAGCHRRDGDGPSNTIPSASQRNHDPCPPTSSRAIAAVAGGAYSRSSPLGSTTLAVAAPSSAASHDTQMPIVCGRIPNFFCSRCDLA